MIKERRTRNCRNCLHYEACGGPSYGCYAAFPVEEETEGDRDLGVPDTLEEAEA